jgi:acetyl esterase
MSVAQARAAARAAARGPDGVLPAAWDALAPGTGGSVPVQVRRPRGRPRGVIVCYPAGGWALGGLAESAELSAALARRTGCAVVSVGYRRAPEYRYPTAVADAWAALQWAAGHLAEIASAGVPLVVAGEGAGGNLAAVVARWSAERAGPPLAAQVLICPVTDCDFDALSYTEAASQLLVDRDAMRWFWDLYAPDPGARRHPDAAPLQAVFLAGLPPAIVVTAEHDVVRDEGELYAMRLVQAGVPVEHRRFAGQPHGFVGLAPALPGARDGLDFIAAALERRLEPGGPAGARPA